MDSFYKNWIFDKIFVVDCIKPVYQFSTNESNYQNITSTYVEKFDSIWKLNKDHEW